MTKFTKDELHGLKKLGDAIKAKDRLDEGKCCPTGDNYVERAMRIQKELDSFKPEELDDRTKKSIKTFKDLLAKRIANAKKDCAEFDTYWKSHQKEILDECAKAEKVLSNIKI